MVDIEVSKIDWIHSDMLKNTSILILLLFAAVRPFVGQVSDEIPFRAHELDLGRNETSAFADLNGDGVMDIIAGENWYEGPVWKKHKFRSFGFFKNYIDNFSDLPIDVDSDGAMDVVSVAWHGKRVAWFKNPGKGLGEWSEHLIDRGANVEFAFLVDINNDGVRRELLPQFAGPESTTAWFEIKGRGVNTRWVRHEISSKSWGHGIGVGDVNGDGRVDVLTPKGWFESPDDLNSKPWVHHADFDLGDTGFLHVYDVDEDGLNDIISTMAHDYGVYWLRQSKSSTGNREWNKELIDDAWSQAHASALVDLTGDGRPELLTGKRFFAHNGHDPGGREPLGVYWYEYFLDGERVVWARHIAFFGGRIGTGMQIPVLDVDRDGDLDFAVAGKSGVFLIENRTR